MTSGGAACPVPEDCVIARVVILATAAAVGTLDYRIEPAHAPAVRPGVRVLVPLGSRQAVGMVVEAAASSPHPRLRDIAAVLDRSPLLDAVVLQLCRWMSEYYLSGFGDVILTALPGSLRANVERIAHPVSDPASPTDALTKLETEMRSYL